MQREYCTISILRNQVFQSSSGTSFCPQLSNFLLWLIEVYYLCTSLGCYGIYWAELWVHRAVAFQREGNVVCRAAYRSEVCKFTFLELLKKVFPSPHFLSTHWAWVFWFWVSGRLYKNIKKRESHVWQLSPFPLLHPQKVLSKSSSILHVCVNEFDLSVMQEVDAPLDFFGEGIIKYTKMDKTLLLWCITVSWRESRSFTWNVHEQDPWILLGF